MKRICVFLISDLQVNMIKLDTCESVAPACLQDYTSAQILSNFIIQLKI